MKKVGICTLHFANNFGAILQAFAMQETLKRLGCDVEFLDLVEPKRRNDLINIEEYEKSKENLKVCPELYHKSKHQYDSIVIGSDELWNLNNPSFEQLDEYYGYNYNTTNIISYAPSANGVTVEQFKNRFGDRIKFEQFKYISARDRATKKLVEDISGRDDVNLVVDPTLLIDFDEYVKYKEPDLKDYIIIYGYEFSEEEKNKILKLAKDTNKKVYSIGFEMEWCDGFKKADIFEFLGYLKNASYVITNTFHGTIFSTLLETQFCVFYENRAKAKDFAERFGLEDREGAKVNDLREVLDKEIDYDNINKLKLKEREHALNYLKNALN